MLVCFTDTSGEVAVNCTGRHTRVWLQKKVHKKQPLEFTPCGNVKRWAVEEEEEVSMKARSIRNRGWRSPRFRWDKRKAAPSRLARGPSGALARWAGRVFTLPVPDDGRRSDLFQRDRETELNSYFHLLKIVLSSIALSI